MNKNRIFFQQIVSACLFVIIGSASNQALALTREISTQYPFKLIINLPSANLNFINSVQKSVTFTISGMSDKDLEEHLLIEPSSQIVQISASTKPWPVKEKIQIDISGSVPVEVHLLDGNVTLTGWTQEALVHLQKGKFTGKGGKGVLALHSQKGEVDLIELGGKFHVDSFASQVLIKNTTADGQVENFMGVTTVEKSHGDFIFKQNQGSLKVQTSGGSLQFETQRASINILGFSGRIEGESQEGNIIVGLSSESDVDIHAKAGKILINSLGLGALVNASMAEGELYLPAPLKVSRDGNAKSYRGRLKGENQKAEVRLKAQDGAITFR